MPSLKLLILAIVCASCRPTMGVVSNWSHAVSDVDSQQFKTFYKKGNGSCHTNDFEVIEKGIDACQCRRGFWAKDSKCVSAFAEQLKFVIPFPPIFLNVLFLS